MGRPPTKPVTFRDGFYIEVRSKDADKGVKVRSDTEQEMLANAEMYKRSKIVVVLGQMKKGVWVNEAEAKKPKEAKAKKKAAK